MVQKNLVWTKTWHNIWFEIGPTFVCGTMNLCFYRNNWAATRPNQQNDLYAQRRLRSAWESAQTDQSSLCAQWIVKDPAFLHADSKDWSDWVDAQSDTNLRWVHRSFCWFCRVAAQIIFKSYPYWIVFMAFVVLLYNCEILEFWNSVNTDIA